MGGNLYPAPHGSLRRVNTTVWFARNSPILCTIWTLTWSMLCIYDEIITPDFEFGNPTSKKKKNWYWFEYWIWHLCWIFIDLNLIDNNDNKNRNSIKNCKRGNMGNREVCLSSWKSPTLSRNQKQKEFLFSMNCPIISIFGIYGHRNTASDRGSISVTVYLFMMMTNNESAQNYLNTGMKDWFSSGGLGLQLVKS